MTGAAWALLATAAVAAVANWWSRRPSRSDDRRLEYVTKPLTMALLVSVALALQPASEGRRWWFVAAGVLSLAGDVFLMLPGDRFVPGLASFLLAHLAYVGGMLVDPPDGTAIVVAALVIGVAAATLAAPVVWSLRRDHRPLTGPVVAYMAVITAMVVLAVASGDERAAVGAALFFVSDYLIARTRFIRPLVWAPVAIMVLYHLGQAGLITSLRAR